MTTSETVALSTPDSVGSALNNVEAPIELQPQLKSPMEEAQRERLLLQHLPQVSFIARRIHNRLPPQVLLEDLVHAGVLGLMDAISKYNPAKNVQLKYYAEFRIRGAILDSLRQVDWSPRTLRSQARRLEQAVFDCKGRLGREPTDTEIAVALEISLSQLQRLIVDLRGLDVSSLQLDLDFGGNGERSLGRFACKEEENPYHQTLRTEMQGLLTGAVDELPVREREVLALYHFAELTMKEVGVAMGIGESRVSQIHSSAMVHVRARLFARLYATPDAKCVPLIPAITRPKRPIHATARSNDSVQKLAG
ncbi:MAG TPA: FliA/WhiG family RNA polymerase sigma factor [Candidatus Sulfotelmatobacter sp.]|jgi:RNA polymerase sigma factor FliA|nr:FliA/WhiG family RNA polymerase sigma factor [Candidatus Sulfotelmatobacter sp.]